MNKTVILLLSVCVLASCKDIVEVDLRSVEPKLVIEGTVRMDAPAEVFITKTKDFDDTNDYIPVIDARVVVADDAGNTEVLQPNATGKYVATTITGVERRTYHLSVTYDDVEYTSTSYMPPRVELDSLTLFKFPLRDYYDPMVHFVDPEGEENQYYRCVLSINGIHPVLNDRLKDRLITTEYADGSIIRQPVFISFESDRDDDPIKQGDVVTVEMQCLDEGVYTYFFTLGNMENYAANPTSNIKGGALGYFGAYSYTAKDLVMEWEE